MHLSDNGRVGDLRTSTRTMIILLVAMAMFVVNAYAPALATGGGDEGEPDLEQVRSEVLGTYTYKIGLLTEKMNATDNADKKAVYADGIAELAGLRDGRVSTEQDIGELWALDGRAHDIYHQTKARANEVGQTPAEKLEEAKKKARGAVEYKTKLLKEWGKCDAGLAREMIAKGLAQLKALYPRIDSAETADAAYGLKEEAYGAYHSAIDKANAACEGEDPRTEEEKAADALKKARRSTLSLIEHKTAILTAAAESTDNAVVSKLYAEAAAGVAGLEEAARSAGSVKALKEIEGQVMALYHEVRDAVAALKGKTDADDKVKDPARHIEAKLAKITRWVDELTEVAAKTAEVKPETYAVVLEARDQVLEAIAAVQEVAESGKKLDARWDDLVVAKKSYEKAFVAHKMACTDGPTVVDGIHVPG